MVKKFLLLLFILFILLTFTACQSNQQSSQQQGGLKKRKLIIAEQYGLAYAPIQLIKVKKMLENAEPGLEIEWKQLSNTAAIREAMLAGRVDIGFMAIPPFLIARDKGMDWQIITGLAHCPLALMSNQSAVNSLADLKPENRIALPQPGSIQHILLTMAAQKEFGQADLFDNQLLTMSHPDAMNALLAGHEVTAHFSSPPYLFKESKIEGIKSIITGQAAFGGNFTFIVGVSKSNFYQENPQLYQVFMQTLQKAVAELSHNPAQAAKNLAAVYDLNQQELVTYLTWPGMKYSQDVQGLKRFADFMTFQGYLTSNNFKVENLVKTNSIFKIIGEPEGND